MSYSFEQYPITTTTVGPFSVPFPYIAQAHVQVRKNGTLLAAGTDYTWPTSATIQLTASAVNGDTIEIRRVTPTTRLVDFTNSANLPEDQLDLDSTQCLYVSLEALDSAANAMQLVSDNTFDALNKRIKNVATPTAASDAVNKAYADAVITTAAGSAAVAAASAAAALASEGAADASEAAAAGSASAAAASASAALTSQTNALNSANAAAAAVVQQTDTAFSWCYNGDFSRGHDSNPAAGWLIQSPGVMSGARITTAGKVKYGTGLELTTISASNYARQRITQLPGFGPYADWNGRTITVGAWVYSTTPGVGSISIVEGTGKVTTSATHSGSGTLEWITVTRAITSGGTINEIEIRLQNTSSVGGTAVTFSGVTVVRGAAVLDYIPSGYRPVAWTQTFHARPADTALAAGATNYMAPSGTHSNDSLQRTFTGKRVLARRMNARTATAPGGTESLAFTLRKGGADTAMTLSIVGASTTGAMSTDISFDESNSMNVKLVASAGIAAGYCPSVTIEWEELPLA